MGSVTRNLVRSVIERLKQVYKTMETIENWRKTVMFVCVVALAIDPLFFFILVIDSHRFRFTLDKKLGVTVCVLRTFIDTLYVIHIILHFITEHIVCRNSQPFYWRRENVKITKEYTVSYFIVDIVSVLPIPQVVVLRKQCIDSLVTTKILKWVVSFQYIPRSIRIYPIFKEATRDFGTVTQMKWVEATLNLFLYLLPSHVIGAFWYMIAIEKKDRCWREVCAKTPECIVKNLYCARGGGDISLFLNTSCPLIEPAEITNSTVFNFGMYINALKSGVVETRDYPRKFFYCFWWGLRNLSALGQNLETSNSVGEIFFAIIICVSGVLLFAVLIGNVQKYLQSNTTRVDEMEEKKRDTDKWMSNRMLPQNLKKRIRSYHDYKWLATRGTEDEALLRSLPKDLRLETKSYLYKHLLMRVPWLHTVGDDRWLLEAVCDRVKSVFYSENSYIVRESEPVEEMLFIMRGNLFSTTTCGGKPGFFNSVNLKAGDFCGDLFTWSLDPKASHFPISSITVQAKTEVEGFVLSADDFKFVVTQYRRLHSDHSDQSKQLQHMFRYYSLQWRTWATCFIQAAWKKHCRRKISKALREEEGKLHNTRQNDDSRGNKLNLRAAIHASRFASTALRNAQKRRSRVSYG